MARPEQNQYESVYTTSMRFEMMTMMRWAIVLAIGAAGTVHAATPLPDEVKQAILEIYSIPPKDQLEWFNTAKVQAVDITGDGSPEYIVELDRLETHGIDQCHQTVMGKGPSGWAEVYNFSCCDYAVQHRKLRCNEDKRVLVQWKGSWPRFDRSPTRTAAKVKYEEGLSLMKGGRYAEAEKILCDLQIRGAPIAEFFAACGWAQLRQQKLRDAEEAFKIVLETEPTYAKVYLGLGAVAEEKKAPAEAAGHYRKYLQMRPSSPEKAALEGKIAELEKGTGSLRAIGPVAADDCGAICDKLLACKAGPWSSKEECRVACGPSNQDPVSGKTYRCAAKAKDCAGVNRCAK